MPRKRKRPDPTPATMSLADCRTFAEVFASWRARTYPTATDYQKQAIEFAFYAGAHSLTVLQARYLDEVTPENAGAYIALVDEVEARMKIYLDSAMNDLLRRSGVDSTSKPN